jgi:hypothetical protein
LRLTALGFADGIRDFDVAPPLNLIALSNARRCAKKLWIQQQGKKGGKKTTG